MKLPKFEFDVRPEQTYPAGNKQQYASLTAYNDAGEQIKLPGWMKAWYEVSTRADGSTYVDGHTERGTRRSRHYFNVKTADEARARILAWAKRVYPQIVADAQRRAEINRQVDQRIKVQDAIKAGGEMPEGYNAYVEHVQSVYDMDDRYVVEISRVWFKGLDAAMAYAEQKRAEKKPFSEEPTTVKFNVVYPGIQSNTNV